MDRFFKWILLICVVAAIASWRAQNQSGWTENEARALARAKSNRKLVLLDFTGSDWCGVCMRMDKEVFSTSEFLAYAKDHLELVRADYPHRKMLTSGVIKQNAALQQQYGIQSVPTLILLDANGKTLKTFRGYWPGGATAFIGQFEAFRS